MSYSKWKGDLCGGRIKSHNLLEIFFSMYPRIHLTFWAAGAHCQLLSNFSSNTISKNFSADMFLMPSSCIETGACPSLGATPCTWHTWVHSFSLSRSYWIVSHSSGVSPYHSASLQRMHTQPLTNVIN